MVDGDSSLSGDEKLFIKILNAICNFTKEQPNLNLNYSIKFGADFTPQFKKLIAENDNVREFNSNLARAGAFKPGSQITAKQIIGFTDVNVDAHQVKNDKVKLIITNNNREGEKFDHQVNIATNFKFFKYILPNCEVHDIPHDLQAANKEEEISSFLKAHNAFLIMTDDQNEYAKTIRDCEEAKRIRYDVKNNIVRVSITEQLEEMISQLQVSEDIRGYLSSGATILMETEDVDYEFVIVERNKKGSACFKKEF